MRGGSLTRFCTDKWYDQHGNGLMTDTVRGGFQGLKRTRNPLKLPSNTLRGLKTGLITRRQTKSRRRHQKRNHQTSQESLGQQGREKSRARGQCFVSQTSQTRSGYFWCLNGSSAFTSSTDS